MVYGQHLALPFQMQQLLLQQCAAFDERGTARLSQSGIDGDLPHRHADLAQTPQEAQPFDILRRVHSYAAAFAHGIQQAQAFVVAQCMRTYAQLGSNLRNAGTHDSRIRLRARSKSSRRRAIQHRLAARAHSPLCAPVHIELARKLEMDHGHRARFAGCSCEPHVDNRLACVFAGNGF